MPDKNTTPAVSTPTGISSVTDAMIKDFCGISDNDSDDLLPVLKSAAKDFIKSYTGLTDEEVAEHESLTDAYLIIINDLFTQREYTVHTSRQINPAVQTILSMHAVNHLR